MEIHHIGYLVKNIEKARQSFEGLGYAAETGIVYDSLRDIDILFMTNGFYRIELVEPKSKESVVADIMTRMGNSPYHICYICNNIAITQNDMLDKGFIPTGEIQPAIAIDNKKVCFMFNRYIG